MSEIAINEVYIVVQARRMLHHNRSEEFGDPCIIRNKSRDDVLAAIASWCGPPPPAGMKRGWLTPNRSGSGLTLFTETMVGQHPSLPESFEIEYRVISPPAPTPARCVCGAEAYVVEPEIDVGGWYVQCESDESCWFGPSQPTRDEAIASWNAIMERKT